MSQESQTHHTQANRLAVFIDFENIEISFRDRERMHGRKDSSLDWKLIFETLSDFGRIVTRRVYADWQGGFRFRIPELQSYGMEIVQVTPSKKGKNSSDIRLALDALESAIVDRAQLTHLVLISGDGDFTALVHHLKAYGKEVFGLGIRGSSSQVLVNACDRFLFYDALEKSEDSTHNFDLTEARDLLRRTLRNAEDEWVLVAVLKNKMLSRDPSFSERNYGFPRFVDFLEAQNDILEIKLNQHQHHIVREKAASTASAPIPSSSEKLPPLEVARRLLVRCVREAPYPWVKAAGLKYQMRKVDPSFDEKVLGFSKFTEFLEAQTDLLLLQNDEHGHPEVQLKNVKDADALSASTLSTPQKTRDLKGLSDEEIREMYLRSIKTGFPIYKAVIPNDSYRSISRYLFEVLNKQQAYSLDEALGLLVGRFQEESYQYHRNVVFQFFHAFCFDFVEEESGERWQWKVSLNKELSTLKAFQRRRDSMIVTKLLRQYKREELNDAIVSQILYGRTKGLHLIEQTSALIDELSSS